MNTIERIEEILKETPLLNEVDKNILKLQLEGLVLQAKIEGLSKLKEETE